MKQALSCYLLFFYTTTSAQVEEILPINSGNIDSLRSEVAAAIFGEETIPEFEFVPQQINRGSITALYVSSNIGSYEVGTVKMKHGFTSKIYIMHPQQDNGLNIPIIYHSGHGYGVFKEDELVNLNHSRDSGVLTMDYFLSKGFTVIGINMPFYGSNTWPAEVLEDDRVYPMISHDYLFNLKNPLYYFIAPISSVINYLQNNRGYNEFIMYGLSGGGWTTTLYSAIDTRIRLSFPVAGTIPIPLRIKPADQGDMEQHYAPFYDRFNYSTLYFLGAAGTGRKQYQVLNKRDNCCFAVNGHDYWESNVSNALKDRNIPGSFEFFYDTMNRSHRISYVSLDSIHKHIIRDMIDEKLTGTFPMSTSRLSNSICDNDFIQLNLSQKESDSVQWFHNGEKIGSAAAFNYRTGEPGNYYALVYNLSGAIVHSGSVDITQNKIFTKPVLTMRDNRLYSSYSSGNNWYYNGNLIEGSTGISILPANPGRYTLRVTSLPCISDFSDPYDFGITVFPNPATNQINVRMSRELHTIFYSLNTTEGLNIAKGRFEGETAIRFNTSVKRGLYFLHLTNGRSLNITRKILVR
jgi:hypothetical protein